MDFLIYNGEIKDKADVNLSEILYSGTFRLKQKIWYGFGGIPLFKENIRLIEKQADGLNLPLPKLFNNKREFFRIVKRMLNKNKFYRSGYILIHLFWQNKKVDTLITSEAFSFFDFPFSEEGILITSSGQKKHSQNTLNQFAYFNETLWNTTLLELNGSYFKNSVVTNEKNAVCECPFSNIYLIKEKKLLTPALKTGCFDDILRPVILETAKSLNLTPDESDSIEFTDLPEMDEIFLASEQTGIQWVLGFKNKRYLHHHSENIYEKLNEILKEKSRN